jgi:hypothetical protein
MVDCADRLAPEEVEGKLDVVTRRAMDHFLNGFHDWKRERKFFMGRSGPLLPLPPGARLIGFQGLYHIGGTKIWEDELDERKEMDVLKQCGMRDEFMCRHCHEEDCMVRLAPRRY